MSLEELRKVIFYDKEWYFYDGYWKIVDKVVISNYIKKLGYQKYINHVHFVKVIENPKHLIGFTNGVYDFLRHKFRPSNPEDYCTLNVGYNYIPTYNEETWHYLSKIFPDKQDYSYFIQTLDFLFKGYYMNICNISSGNNGVSTLYRIINFMFGSYKIRTEYIVLNSRYLYQNMTGLEKYEKEFKGRYIMIESDNINYIGYDICNNIVKFTSCITTTNNIDNISKLNCTRILRFKSTFVNNDKNYNLSSKVIILH